MRRALISAVLMCLASCTASREFFVPRENLRAQSPRGWPAAQYPLLLGGKDAGEAKVWSEGAAQVGHGDEKRTVLHIGFEIENRTATPMSFDVDRCRVSDLQTNSRDGIVLTPHEESGQLTIGPGLIGLLDFEFLLPRDTRPRDIESFRLVWVISDDAETLVKSTPFRVDDTRNYRRTYYDPWWGVGVGYHYGHFGHYHHHHHHGWHFGPRVHFWAW
jgi:hypothetical protein